MKDLNRVFWLSGSPCAGKTTVSGALAERFGWNVYHVDEHWDSHKERACPDKQPNYFSITRVTGDKLWLRPLEEQIRTEPLFVEEAFPLILEDIKELLRSDKRALIVDASVVPTSIVPLLPATNHIFYLIPEEKFQRHHYALRPSIKPTLAKTTDPELAFSNWMARDAAYAQWLEREVRKHELACLVVDGAVSLEDTIGMVATHYLGKRARP
jgi:hypothetical protein